MPIVQVPHLTTPISFWELPNSVIDILYFHNKLSTEVEVSICRDAFAQLSALCTPQPHDQLQKKDSISIADEPSIAEESRVLSYVFESHPSSIKLACIAAALLCHPLRRPPQQEFLKKMSIDPAALDTLRESLSRYASAQTDVVSNAPTSSSGAVIAETGDHQRGGANSGKRDSSVETTSAGKGSSEESRGKKMTAMLFSNMKPASGSSSAGGDGEAKGASAASSSTASSGSTANESSSMNKMKSFFGR
jgi:hypothetical protein